MQANLIKAIYADPNRPKRVATLRLYLIVDEALYEIALFVEPGRMAELRFLAFLDGIVARQGILSEHCRRQLKFKWRRNGRFQDS
jgi:hypothetical protein